MSREARNEATPASGGRSYLITRHDNPIATTRRFAKLEQTEAHTCRALGSGSPGSELTGAPTAALVTSIRAFASGSYRKRVRPRTSKRDASIPPVPGPPGSRAGADLQT